YTLGSVDDAFEQKKQAQREYSLEPIAENPTKVIARMPPISPPLAGAECLEIQDQTEGRRQRFTKQSTLDSDTAGDDGSTSGNKTSTDDDTTTIIASTTAS
ncbi:unnamed protein product, partial [Rotaria sordida]